MTEPVDVPLPAYKARSWYGHYSWLDSMVRWMAAAVRDVYAATSEETASTLVRRSSGRSIGANAVFGLAAPIANDNAANKGYVDALGTAAATADTVVRRGSGAGFTNLSGLYIVNSPVTASEATRKDYVDSAADNASSRGDLAVSDSAVWSAATVDLSAWTTPATRIRTLSTNVAATVLPNFPANRSGTVVVIVKQAAAGGPYTMTWPAGLPWADGASAPAMPTQANAELHVALFYTGAAWRARHRGTYFP